MWDETKAEQGVSTVRLRGTVTSVARELGIAFIAHPRGNVFLHRSDLHLEHADRETVAWPLRPGERVTYRLVAGPKGLCAKEVRRCEGASFDAGAEADETTVSRPDAPTVHAVPSTVEPGTPEGSPALVESPSAEAPPAVADTRAQPALEADTFNTASPADSVGASPPSRHNRVVPPRLSLFAP